MKDSEHSDSLDSGQEMLQSNLDTDDALAPDSITFQLLSVLSGPWGKIDFSS